MIRSPSQLPGTFRSEMSGRFNRSTASQQWGVCARLWGGFLAHPPARGQANAVLDERLLGMCVDPRVDRLVANCVALGVGRSVHGGQCATRFGAQAPADLAGSVSLGQISNPTAAKNIITIQQTLLRATPGRLCCLAGLLGPILPVRARMAGDLTAHHRGATPNQVGDTHLGQTRYHPAMIAARSSTLNIRRQLTTSPSNSTATTQIAYTLCTAQTQPTMTIETKHRAQYE